MCEDFVPKNRSKKQKRIKNRTKHRSPYAKALEDNRYRKRIIESRRKEDIDNWVEEALDEYFNEKIPTRKVTEKDQTSRQSHEDNDC